MQIVTAGIIEKENKILIAKKKNSKWEFPGGKLEKGETPEQCLERELFEELEIKTRTEDFICSSKFSTGKNSFELLAYKSTYISGKIKLHDHEEIKWIFPEELKNYEFTDPDIVVVNKLLKDIYHVV